MKDSKFPYYFSNALLMLVPRFVYRAQAKRLLSTLTEAEKQYCLERVNYYNKCGQPFTVDSREQSYAKIGEFKKTKGWTYFSIRAKSYAISRLSLHSTTSMAM